MSAATESSPDYAALNTAMDEKLHTTLDELKVTALRIKAERDHMEGALRDLVRGADMLIPYMTGAALHFAQEVKRVAAAAITPLT